MEKKKNKTVVFNTVDCGWVEQEDLWYLFDDRVTVQLSREAIEKFIDFYDSIVRLRPTGVGKFHLPE